MEKFIIQVGNKSIVPALQKLKRQPHEKMHNISHEYATVGVVLGPKDKMNIHRTDICLTIELGTILGFRNIGKNYDIQGDGMVIQIYKETTARLASIEILTDPWFRRPVYYSDDLKTMSSEIKAILPLLKTKPKLDKIAIDCFIALHMIYGRRTLFETIKSLPSGVAATFTLEGLSLTLYDYHKDYDYESTFEEHVNRVATLFQLRVHELEKGGIKGLFLSGGIDSRLLLAASTTLKAINLGNSTCTETRIAKKAAKLAEKQIQCFDIRPEDIILNCEYSSYITEGAAHLGSSVMLKTVIDNPDTMNGNPGDLTIGGTWAGKLAKYPIRVGAEFPYGEAIAKSSINLHQIEKLFGHKKDERMREIYRLIQDEFVYLEDFENEDLKLEMYALQNRVLRGGSIVINSDYGLMNQPFLWGNIVEACLAVPIEWRKQRRFQMAVLKKLSPALADLESTSMDEAKPQKIKNTIFEIIKKIPILNDWGRKYVHRKLAEKPEDHYVMENTWMRTSLPFRDFMMDKLSEFKERSIVEGVVVTDLVMEHILKKRNNMPIIGTLVDLEILISLFHDE